MVQSQSTPSIEPTTLGHACRFPTLATGDAAALAALAALWARHPATVVPSLTTDGTTHLIDLRPGTHPPLHSSSFDAYWHRQCTCHCKPSESMEIHPEKGTTHPIVLAPQSCHQQGSDGTQKTGQGNVTSVALLLTRREVHSTIRKWSWHMLA